MKVFDDTHEPVVEVQTGIVINLQLFAEDEEDLTEDGWGGADEADDSEDLADETDDDTGEKDSEFATLKQSKAQGKDENAVYANMRRKAEAEAQAKFSRDKEEIETARRQLDEERRLNSISQDAIWQKADEEGVSEDVARKMLIFEEREKLFKERESKNTRESEIIDQKKKLRGEKYFAELEAEIDSMVATHADVNVEGVFHYLRSVKLEDLMNGKLKAQEKRTIANIQDKARRGSISSEAGGSNNVKSTGLTKKLSDVWGFNENDQSDIQKHVSKRRKELKN